MYCSGEKIYLRSQTSNLSQKYLRHHFGLFDYCVIVLEITFFRFNYQQSEILLLWTEKLVRADQAIRSGPRTSKIFEKADRSGPRTKKNLKTRIGVDRGPVKYKIVVRANQSKLEIIPILIWLTRSWKKWPAKSETYKPEFKVWTLTDYTELTQSFYRKYTIRLRF